jgi:beta-lactam-binding protein with PASTA domain/tRNA A-37 threonylcarbamoyl transferase component Bud32
MRDLAPETIVDQRYQILLRIGSGGMADVYCAQDLQLGRKVALKLLYRRFAEDEEFVERFRREASSAAGLQHANVVGVYDRGEWDGTYYIAMEYLEGHSLKQLINERGPLPPLEAIEIAVQILRAARFAHRRGVIHRDIKPHNVIVDEEGRAKVTDFGIARAGASDMTETGSIMGTAQYLSPEQAQGHAVSARSDLYAIGIVLYEMLAGRVPFDGDSAVTIALKQVSEAPVPPSAYNAAVPPALDAIVLRALEKDPEQRFTDADEFIAALEQLRGQLALVPGGRSTAVFGAIGGPMTDPTALAAAGVPVEEPAEAPPEDGQPTDEGHRRRWPWIAAALLVLAALAAVFLILGPLSPKKVQVRNVVGTKLSVGKAILENQGFKVQVTPVVSPQERDQILRQDPQPNTKADEGSTVSLTVSGGPGQASVPGVDGLTQSQARRKIAAVGFKVSVSREASESVPSGTATRTAPPAGTQIDKGTTVTLFISSGPQSVTVPSVVGQSQDTASAELANVGLKVSITQQDSTTENPGTVLSQDPAAGSQAGRGSTVTITVARQPQQVTVPNTVGQGQSAALTALADAGLTPIVGPPEAVTNRAEDGKVLAQAPSGGKVKRGTRVTITVGQFTPVTTPPPTTTP